MPVPALSPEQRSAALAKAADARRARAEMLDALKSGEVSLVDVLDRTDEVARRTKVAQVLKALPGYGPAKVAKLMTDADVDDKRRVGGLGVQQRRKLVEAASS